MDWPKMDWPKMVKQGLAKNGLAKNGLSKSKGEALKGGVNEVSRGGGGLKRGRGVKGVFLTPGRPPLDPRETPGRPLNEEGVGLKGL